MIVPTYETTAKEQELIISRLEKENQSLKKENKILRENTEHNDKVVDKVNWENMLLKKENEQLKDNWNKLKEHLTNRYNNGTESISYRQVFIEIREAMQVLEIQQELEQRRQELEQGSDK